MVQYVYKTDEKAGGVVSVEGVPEVQWTALHKDSQWYVLIHSDRSFDDRGDFPLECLLNMIQNSLKYKLAA